MGLSLSGRHSAVPTTSAPRREHPAPGAHTAASSCNPHAHADLPARLSAGELERYQASAQLLSWIELSPRSSPHELQASRITVLGVGGIGSDVAAAPEAPLQSGAEAAISTTDAT